MLDKKYERVLKKCSLAENDMGLYAHKAIHVKASIWNIRFW